MYRQKQCLLTLTCLSYMSEKEREVEEERETELIGAYRHKHLYGSAVISR